MLTQIHAMALAKFVFVAKGIEPVAINLADKIRLASISVFWGRNRLVSHNSMTAPSPFEDRRIVALRLAANSRVIQAYVRAEADVRSRSDSSIGGHGK